MAACTTDSLMPRMRSRNGAVTIPMTDITSDTRKVRVKACRATWFARSTRRAPIVREISACIPTSRPMRAIMIRCP